MNQVARKNIDYLAIVKKAFIYPLKYRYLFWLGVLAVFASGGGGGNFNFSGSSGDWQNLFNNQDDKSSFLDSVKSSAPRVLGESTSKFESWISAHWFWIALVILILLLIFLALFVLGMIARAGIIRSIIKIERSETSNFKDAMKDGKRFFWRLIGQSLLIFCLMLVLVGVLAGVAIALFLVNKILGFFWLIPAILFFVIAVVYIGLIVKFWAQMFIVEDKRIFATLRPAIKLVNTRFKEVITFWLINLVIAIIYFVAVALVVIIILLPFVLIAIAVGFINLIAGIIIGSVGFLILSLVMLVVPGYYTAGVESYWTLAYLDLRNSKS